MPRFSLSDVSSRLKAFRKDDELSKSKGTIKLLSSPRNRRTGSVDTASSLSPRSLFAKSNSVEVVASAPPPSNSESLGTRGRPVLLAHMTSLAGIQCDSGKLQAELKRMSRPMVTWAQQQLMSRRNVSGNMSELRKLLSDCTSEENEDLAAALVASDSIVTDIPIMELANMSAEEHARINRDEWAFFGNRMSADVATLLLERILKLSPMLTEARARLAQFQNPDMTNEFELAFKIVTEELQVARLPQVFLFVIARMTDNAKREQLVAGLLCIYSTLLCDSDRAKHAIRVFFSDAFPAPKTARRPSIMGSRSSLRSSGRSTSVSGPSCNNVAASAPVTTVTVTSEWTKTSDRVMLGAQKKCTECAESVSEVIGFGQIRISVDFFFLTGCWPFVSVYELGRNREALCVRQMHSGH